MLDPSSRPHHRKDVHQIVSPLPSYGLNLMPINDIASSGYSLYGRCSRCCLALPAKLYALFLLRPSVFKPSGRGCIVACLSTKSSCTAPAAWSMMKLACVACSHATLARRGYRSDPSHLLCILPNQNTPDRSCLKIPRIFIPGHLPAPGEVQPSMR